MMAIDDQQLDERKAAPLMSFVSIGITLHLLANCSWMSELSTSALLPDCVTSQTLTV